MPLRSVQKMQPSKRDVFFCWCSATLLSSLLSRCQVASSIYTGSFVCSVYRCLRVTIIHIPRDLIWEKNTMIATHRFMQNRVFKEAPICFVWLLVSTLSLLAFLVRRPTLKRMFILLLCSLFLDFKYTKILREIVLQEGTALKSNLW
jgi:hypothetical protein